MEDMMMRYILDDMKDVSPRDCAIHIGVLATALVVYESDPAGFAEPVDAETVGEARRAILAWWADEQGADDTEPEYEAEVRRAARLIYECTIRTPPSTKPPVILTASRPPIDVPERAGDNDNERPDAETSRRFDQLMEAIDRATPPYPYPLPVRRLTRQSPD